VNWWVRGGTGVLGSQAGKDNPTVHRV